MPGYIPGQSMQMPGIAQGPAAGAQAPVKFDWKKMLGQGLSSLGQQGQQGNGMMPFGDTEGQIFAPNQGQMPQQIGMPQDERLKMLAAKLKLNAPNLTGY